MWHQMSMSERHQHQSDSGGMRCQNELQAALLETETGSPGRS